MTHQEKLQEIIDYFTTHPPKEEKLVAPYFTIYNVKQFIESHISFSQNYNQKNPDNPYFTRLKQYYNYFKKQNQTT